MKKIIVFLFVALFSFGAAIAEAKPKVIGMKRAQVIASARARGLKLRAKELEKENGRWIYSFEFQNKDGSIREINVNARTGKVIGVEHEDAKKGANEMKSERNKKN